MLKKMFKTVLVLSLCIGVVLPTNAAVSVSDGSAFVTKAEFAADLNNLSNRMAQLENSLDAKIDSLVSSYLTRNGIWNGAKQIIANNCDQFNTRAGAIFLDNCNKSGLLFMPIFTHIDFEVGLCSGNTGSATSDSIARMMGSPVFFGINIQLDILKNNQPYQNIVYFYSLTGEYDTASTLAYAAKLDIIPSQNLLYFVEKGSSYSYKLSTELNIRADWWAMKKTVTGNEYAKGSLSGTAITASNNAKANWNTDSHYSISFKTTELSVY